MGMLDFVPRKEWKPPTSMSNYDGGNEPVEVLCGMCGNNFTGKRWMLNTKKDVTCRKCYEDTRSFYDNM